MAQFPPGIVAVPRSDLARFVSFEDALIQLQMPTGAVYQNHKGPSVARNCNAFCRKLLETPEFAWIWFMGDDHVFAPDTLLRLLAHDQDIVVPLVTNKKPPIAPVWFSRYDPDAQEFHRVNFADLPTAPGLVPLFAAGTAGMLVKRHVIEKLHDPWFEFGRINPEMLSEDLWFCVKAQEAGFRIHGDPQTYLGHTTTTTVWPYQREDGQWGMEFEMGGELEMKVRVVA